RDFHRSGRALAHPVWAEVKREREVTSKGTDFSPRSELWLFPLSVCFNSQNHSGGISMRVKAGIFVAVLSLLTAAVPLLAHHSFAAEYDSNKPITVTGTVTKMEWMNPHARFYVDVKDANGKVTSWNFELGAIPVLLK